MKREANFTLLFRHWLKANYCLLVAEPIGVAFELKQTTKDSLPFSAVKEHQLDALLAVQTEGGFLYKAPDDSRGVKPFDMFYLRDADGYVVIKYPLFFVIIDVDEFIEEKKNSKRKSLTGDRAKAIADVIVHLTS